MSTINDLPIEILTKILDDVLLYEHTSVIIGEIKSYIGKLFQCNSCEYSKKKCIHIGDSDGRSLKKIISICKLWYIIIQDHNFSIYKPSNINKHQKMAYTLNF
jgi:hypothetical protein